VSSESSFPFRFSNQNVVCICYLSHSCSHHQRWNLKRQVFRVFMVAVPLDTELQDFPSWNNHSVCLLLHRSNSLKLWKGWNGSTCTGALIWRF
jgi:hypothetical protein